MTNNTNNNSNTQTTSHEGVPAHELTEQQCFDRMDWALAILDDESQIPQNKYIAKRAIKHVKERLYFLTVGESTQDTIDRI